MELDTTRKMGLVGVREVKPKAMVRLHLGSGAKRYHNWVNIDKFNPKAEVQADACDLPYDHNSVEAILTSHMVEHLFPQDFEKALLEWKRVLRPNGHLYIRCPNGEYYLRKWLNATDDERLNLNTGLRNGILGHHLGGEPNINRNLFTPSMLKRLVEKAGFQVKTCMLVPPRDVLSDIVLVGGGQPSPEETAGPDKDIWVSSVSTTTKEQSPKETGTTKLSMTK